MGARRWKGKHSHGRGWVECEGGKQRALGEERMAVTWGHLHGKHIPNPTDSVWDQALSSSSAGAQLDWLEPGLRTNLSSAVTQSLLSGPIPDSSPAPLGHFPGWLPHLHCPTRDHQDQEVPVLLRLFSLLSAPPN